MSTYERTENFDALLSCGMTENTAEALDRFLQEGYIEELSSDLIDKFALMTETNASQCIEKIKKLKKKNLPVADVVPIVDQFVNAENGDLEVNEVSAEQEKMETEVETTANGPASGSTAGDSNSKTIVDFGKYDPKKQGPDEEKLKKILDDTGYPHEVKEGMRRYGGPPPGMSKERPELGTEIFINRIPKDIFEDALIPLFGSIGKIWELRVLTTEQNQNRGHGFVTYCNKEDAKKAVEEFNRYEVRPGSKLNVQIAVRFNKLHMKNIPKSKSREEMKKDLSEVVDALLDVTFVVNSKESVTNNGYCFLEFDSYFEASNALKKLRARTLIIGDWEDRPIVDWAIPTENPDEDAVKTAKSIRIFHDGPKEEREKLTEDVIKEAFGKFGDIERQSKGGVAIIIEFKEHDSAVKAVEEMNDSTVAGLKVAVTLIVPLADYAAKKKKAMQRGGGRTNNNRNIGGQFNRQNQNMDARQLIARRSNIASRVGGPQSRLGGGQGAISRIGGPPMGGSAGPMMKPTGDVRAQLGNKRKMPPPHEMQMRQASPPPRPLMRGGGPMRREREEGGGMYMAGGRSAPPPPGPSEAMMMEELMILRRRNEELSRSLTMDAPPAKRSYGGFQSAYGSAYAMASSRDTLMDPLPSRPMMRETLFREPKQEPTFYDDDPYNLPSFGRSGPAIRERRELLVGASLDRSPAPIERKVVAPPKVARSARGGGLLSSRTGSAFGMREDSMEDIQRQYGGGNDLGGFSGGFTGGRLGGRGGQQRRGMTHAQIAPARDPYSRMSGGASFTRF